MKLKQIAFTAFLVTGAAQAATVTVKITNAMKFEPSPVEVHVGDTIEFVNESNKPHTVTADPALAKDPANVILPTGADTFNSGRLDGGQSFSQDFDTEGDYQYVCLFHERMGMMGQVKVVH